MPSIGPKPDKKGDIKMARPVTLFTGQWADLDIESMCQKAKDFGYDGLELACWGDHFEVEKATNSYCKIYDKTIIS